MSIAERLNYHEINVALDFFTYYLSMETRELLMQEHPLLYNKLMDREIMTVIKTRYNEERTAELLAVGHLLEKKEVQLAEAEEKLHALEVAETQKEVNAFKFTATEAPHDTEDR